MDQAACLNLVNAHCHHFVFATQVNVVNAHRRQLARHVRNPRHIFRCRVQGHVQCCVFCIAQHAVAVGVPKQAAGLEVHPVYTKRPAAQVHVDGLGARHAHRVHAQFAQLFEAVGQVCARGLCVHVHRDVVCTRKMQLRIGHLQALSLRERNTDVG